MRYDDYDTICAMATPAGGAMTVIRISGPASLRIADSIFRGSQPGVLLHGKGYHLYYGEIADTDGRVIDQVMASVYRAPHSYTGEDSVELSCHGSRYIAEEVLRLLVSRGCRMARGGEYTQRAFLNGKMDLSQAEAVADLITSSSRVSHRLAISQLRGSISNELSELRSQLEHITALMELELDFSDHEDLEFADRSELVLLAQRIEHRIDQLLRSFHAGRAAKSGISVAIVGSTNVGKSTLLNRLLGEDRAIVSEVHGTTRDVIEDVRQIHGVAFRFIDTAGIRATNDAVERIGIERSWQQIDQAEIVLWMVDRQPLEAERAEMEERCRGRHLLIVGNKSDLGHIDGVDIMISAKHDESIEALEEKIYAESGIEEWQESDVVVTSMRHYEALQLASADIRRVSDGMAQHLPTDLLSEDLRQCIHHLSEIIGGEITPDATLQTIFSKFCVGK